jgi:hypothetical protein
MPPLPASARRRLESRTCRADREKGSKAPAHGPACLRPRTRALVDLEQPEFGSARGYERRRDPGKEVGAGSVPRQLVLLTEDTSGHRGGRRLSVGRRYECTAERQLGGEGVDRPRIQLPEQLSGQRRSAPAAHVTEPTARAAIVSIPMRTMRGRVPEWRDAPDALQIPQNALSHFQHG